jgi:hypothetical protein
MYSESDFGIKIYHLATMRGLALSSSPKEIMGHVIEGYTVAVFMTPLNNLDFCVSAGRLRA